MNTFFHTGDLGDLVAAMPSIRSLKGGHVIIGHKPDGQRESMAGTRFEAIVPLLLSQPYVQRVTWGNIGPGMLDFSEFRKIMDHGMNLAYWQALHIQTTIRLDPWLMVPPDPRSSGRPVIARSPRYHNPDFPWKSILERIRPPVFVGLPQEHAEFCREFGEVEHIRTGNLLEIAKLIAGGSIFIGNQSSPFWIAAGLGSRLIQETCMWAQNSIIHQPGMYYPAFNGYKLDGFLDGVTK